MHFMCQRQEGGLARPAPAITLDFSTGYMFSDFLRYKVTASDSSPRTRMSSRTRTDPAVEARLYPIEYLADFRKYFNKVWLSKGVQ